MNKKIIIIFILLVIIITILFFVYRVECLPCPSSAKPLCDDSEKLISVTSKSHWYCSNECTYGKCLSKE